MGGASAPMLFFQVAATGWESVGAQASPTKAWRGRCKRRERAATKKAARRRPLASSQALRALRTSACRPRPRSARSPRPGSSWPLRRCPSRRA
ncbi:DUF6053 domain-containing protein [Lysobacter enzymogenes]|uniref:DUF6053 domain-containing protein n=1 Tax=Lysobacter enzymogenes TaxID=69 RepID=UPI003D2F822A